MFSTLSFVSYDQERLKQKKAPRNFWDVKSSGNVFEDEFYGRLYADQFVEFVKLTRNFGLLSLVVSDMTNCELDLAQLRFFERVSLKL